MTGVLDAFWAYETALMANDLQALDSFFSADPGTTRGDEAGLLRGPVAINGFRSTRGGAPRRSIVSFEVREIDAAHALVTAVTAPASGGRGLQTQLWTLGPSGWAIEAAHVTAPPRSYDSRVWRLVGDPLVSGGSGPLSGEMLAVKDLFAVAGQRIGAGVPEFLASSPVEEVTAEALRRMLDAGAGIRGIAQTDQFAYSLAGDNDHYGTPPNAVVAGGLPGGSSSGSATAVALGAASLGLGTDTAGSIRVPASYQGLWGLRTTHGSVPTRGLIGLAPDFDAIGLLARTGETLGRAAAVLLGDRGNRRPEPGLLTSPGLSRGLPVHDGFSAWLAEAGSVEEVNLPGTAEIADAFRIHQGWQAWALHGRWILDHPGALRGPAAVRFAAASSITAADNAVAVERLIAWRSETVGLLGDRVLVLPAAASGAPRVWERPEAVDALRAATIRLTCIASILGRPALAVPGLSIGEDPVGISLVGPPDSELALVTSAQELSGPRHRPAETAAATNGQDGWR